MALTWEQIQGKLKAFDKKDIIIYDDNHDDGNQFISVAHKKVIQFKIRRPFMNKLKRSGYKIERREIEK